MNRNFSRVISYSTDFSMDLGLSYKLKSTFTIKQKHILVSVYLTACDKY